MEELDYDPNPESGSPLAFLSDPTGVLRRRWRWILTLGVLGSLVASVVLVRWPARYQAEAKLLFSGQSITDEFVRSPLASSLEEDVSTMVGDVLAAESLKTLIDEFGLAERFGPDLAFPALLNAVRAAIEIEPETIIGRRRGKDSFIYAVRFETDDPETAAAVANDLVNRLKDAHLSRRSRQAQVTTEFLRREMERTEGELGEQTAKVSAYTRKYRGQLPSELPTNLARLERLQQQRASLALQISEAESRLLSVRTQTPPGDSRAQLLSQLRSRLASEQAVNTDEHPNVVSLRRQITALEEELARNPASWSNPGVGPIERELTSLRTQLAHAEQQIRDLDARVGSTPARQEELDALLRQEQVLRESFAAASRKVEQAELAENLERSQQGIKVSRLATAFPPAQPKYPMPLLAAGAVGAVLGLALGMACLLELLDPVLLTARQVETETGLLNLGIVPKIG